MFRCRPQKRINGQNVLVTGGADGIGAEFALRFAEMDNTVHILDYNEELLNKKVEELQGRGFDVKGYQCDLTKWEAIKEVHEKLQKDGVFISYIVNNAGVYFAKDIVEYSHSQLEYEIKLNLVSYLWVTKLFLPAMKLENKGHIINIASLAGIFPLYNGTAYCASKAGVIHFSEALRFALTGTDIIVTAICPTFIKTKLITGAEDGLEKSFVLLTKEQLLDVAMKAVRENKELVLVPRGTWIRRFVLMFLPAPLKKVHVKSSVTTMERIYKSLSGQGLDKKIA